MEEIQRLATTPATKGLAAGDEGMMHNTALNHRCSELVQM
jgi:hypothetical protein